MSTLRGFLMPAALLLGLIAYSFVVLHDNEKKPSREILVGVTAQQFQEGGFVGPDFCHHVWRDHPRGTKDDVALVGAKLHPTGFQLRQRLIVLAFPSQGPCVQRLVLCFAPGRRLCQSGKIGASFPEFFDVW